MYIYKLTLNACASHRIIRSKLAWGLKGKKGLCLSSDPQVLLDCEFRIISLTQFPQLNLTSKWKAMSLDPAGVSWMFTVNLQKNKRKTFKTFRGPRPTEQWRAEQFVPYWVQQTAKDSGRITCPLLWLFRRWRWVSPPVGHKVGSIPCTVWAEINHFKVTSGLILLGIYR